MAEQHTNYEEDAPMTQGQFQTLRNLMYRQLNKMDSFENELRQVKRDVNTIAENTGHERDTHGQLRKTA